LGCYCHLFYLVVLLLVSDKTGGVFLAEPIDIIAVAFKVILFLNKIPKVLKEKKIS